MDELGLDNIQQLEAALSQAIYAMKYCSGKFSDLSTQVEQMALFAAEPSLKE
jgi:hypothetical protein